MIAALLPWLDLHPPLYFLLAGGLTAGALVRAVAPLWRKNFGDPRGPDWAWGACLTAILAAGRWPSWLYPREFNADESQLLAGAHALVADPVFWRAVDAGSSGPLNFFVLWPAGAIFGWQTYLTARVTAFALVAVILVLAHQALALGVGRRVARVVTLGAVAMEALTNGADLLHYSTELLPLALITAAIYAAVRRWFHQGGTGWNALGGLLLGAVPLTKLQGIPLALAFGALWVVAEWRTGTPARNRRLAYLIGGALLPVLLFAGQVTIARLWPDVIISYFTYNLHYTAKAAFPLRYQLLVTLANSLAQDSLLHLWLAGSLIWAALVLRWKSSADRATRLFLWIALAAAPLAFWSAIYPGRAFLHYWQFSVMPGIMLVGALTGNFLSAPAAPWRPRLVAGLAILLTGGLLVQRALNPNELLGTLAATRAAAPSELSRHILAHAQPGDTIAIWGWTNHVYVETGLRQATRDAQFERAVEPGPYQDYFRERFLADLMQAGPDIFLDSVGPGSLGHQSAKYRPEQSYPKLAAVIRANYDQVDELDGARIYRRRVPAGR